MGLILPLSKFMWLNVLHDFNSSKDRYYVVLLSSKACLPKFPPTHFQVSARVPLGNEGVHIL
jgi:hypothetical protein